MPSSRTGRAASIARAGVPAQVKDDHKRVKKAHKDFQKRDINEDSEAGEVIVQQVLQELTVHAALEEEPLYPAARAAIADEDLIDEAEVEHESVHTLIDQLRGMSPDDENYAARFTVLCEYVLHHAKEEEGEMFPQLESARPDWEALAAEVNERRAELSGVEARGTGARASAEGEERDEGARIQGSGTEDTERVGEGARELPRSTSRARTQRV
jgi:hemerythrin superfamily protein